MDSFRMMKSLASGFLSYEVTGLHITAPYLPALCCYRRAMLLNLDKSVIFGRNFTIPSIPYFTVSRPHTREGQTLQNPTNF